MRLKNRTRRTVSFTLAHKVVCTDGACLCTPGEFLQRAHNTKTGDVGTRTIKRLIASSVFLAPGHESEDLPETVKELSDVAARMSRGDLIEI